MNSDLSAQLQTLVERDQTTRQRLLDDGQLYGRYDDGMQHVHIENAEALDALIDQFGWPGIALVGKTGCRHAWLIAQHSICTPELQRKFERRLRVAVEAGDAPRRQLAWLTDRIRFNEGKPLIYGTVLDWTRDGELGCQLEDPDQLDARRADVGLPPYADALREQRREIESEGAKPPDNFSAYQQAQQDWAERVGWRPADQELTV